MVFKVFNRLYKTFLFVRSVQCVNVSLYCKHWMSIYLVSRKNLMRVKRWKDYYYEPFTIEDIV